MRQREMLDVKAARKRFGVEGCRGIHARANVDSIHDEAGQQCDNVEYGAHMGAEDETLQSDGC